MRVITPQQKYLNDVFGLDTAELKSVRDEMETGGVAQISISSAEARLLQFLIRGFGVCRIVEFGTLFGYSTLAMAAALPSDGVVVTLEKNPANFAQAERSFAASKYRLRIRSMCGDAKNLMNEVSALGPFDLIFIDANKSAYVEYLNWAEQNLRVGGLIVGDNTFLWGGVWGPETTGPPAIMREFNARLADPSRYNSTLIPTAEGMTVAQKII